jgi:membrane protein
MGGRRWWATLKRTFGEFRARSLTDAAAALTYYAVLSIFPMLLVLVALVGLFGSYPATVDSLLRIVRDVAPASTVNTVRGTITSIVQNKGGAGALFGVALLGSLWSASGYLGALMRTANGIYGTAETRPWWRQRGMQLGLTVMLIVAVAIFAVGFTFTGSLARSAGRTLGAGDAGITAFQIAKWPFMAAVAALLLALLYYFTPNVHQPRFRWVTPGGLVGLAVLVVASVGFAFYVAHFGSYNKTYGTLGGVIVFLVWLWIANVALVFGLLLDAELERERELAAGIPAHDRLAIAHEADGGNGAADAGAAGQPAAGRTGPAR